jgi:hypothetical protein
VVLPTIERPPSAPPPQQPTFLPATRLGRWALGLLVVIALFPAYWAPLGRALRDPPWIILVPAAIALPGFITGALAARHERSTALRVLFWLAATEVALTAAVFLMMGLGGG